MQEGRAEASENDRSREPRLVWLEAGGGKCREETAAWTFARQQASDRVSSQIELHTGQEILRVIATDSVPLGTRVGVLQIDL